MATNVTLDEELYKWLSQTATLRLERERAGVRLVRFATKNERDMAALGVTEGDIDREIDSYRLGR